MGRRRPRRPRSVLPLACLLSLATLALGCGDETTVVIVRLEARLGVHDDDAKESDPTDLLVTFKSDQDQTRQQTILVPQNGQPFFPSGSRNTVFSILANGRSGPAQITAQARAADMRPLGDGQNVAIVTDKEQVETQLVLRPTDFQVNTLFPNSQIFSFTGPGGRQVASDAQGNFVVVWEDEECGGAGRCDIAGRLFDKSARARLNGALGSKDEFRVNLATSLYDHPAVAAQADGAFMTTWINSVSSANYQIEIRPFLSDGRPNPAVASEAVISTTTEDAVSPDIAALQDGNYVVCWVEATATGYQVPCRLVDRNAAPVAGAGGSTAPFVAGKNEPATTPVLNVFVAVAAGPQNSFMVVWGESCTTGTTCWKLKGRIYSGGAFGAILDIAKVPTLRAGPFDVAGLPYGFMVVWTDALTSTPSDGTDIRARRFSTGSLPLEDEFTLNTSLTGSQGNPTIATLPNGSILVAWETDDGTQDPEGGIRGRAMLGNGLPVGGDFALNSTDTDKQQKPALAAVGPDAFIMVFLDSSKLWRDKFSSGIRGRLIYPELNTADGQVGAQCGTGKPDCAGGLRCQAISTPATPAEARCVNTCQQADAPCINGGRCLKLAGTANDHICVYQMP